MPVLAPGAAVLDRPHRLSSFARAADDAYSSAFIRGLSKQARAKWFPNWVPPAVQRPSSSSGRGVMVGPGSRRGSRANSMMTDGIVGGGGSRRGSTASVRGGSHSETDGEFGDSDHGDDEYEHDEDDAATDQGLSPSQRPHRRRRSSMDSTAAASERARLTVWTRRKSRIGADGDLIVDAPVTPTTATVTNADGSVSVVVVATAATAPLAGRRKSTLLDLAAFQTAHDIDDAEQNKDKHMGEGKGDELQFVDTLEASRRRRRKSVGASITNGATSDASLASEDDGAGATGASATASDADTDAISAASSEGNATPAAESAADAAEKARAALLERPAEGIVASVFSDSEREQSIAEQNQAAATSAAVAAAVTDLVASDLGTLDRSDSRESAADAAARAPVSASRPSSATTTVAPRATPEQTPQSAAGLPAKIVSADDGLSRDDRPAEFAVAESTAVSEEGSKPQLPSLPPPPPLPPLPTLSALPALPTLPLADERLTLAPPPLPPLPVLPALPALPALPPLPPLPMLPSLPTMPVLSANQRGSLVTVAIPGSTGAASAAASAAAPAAASATAPIGSMSALSPTSKDRLAGPRLSSLQYARQLCFFLFTILVFTISHSFIIHYPPVRPEYHRPSHCCRPCRRRLTRWRRHRRVSRSPSIFRATRWTTSTRRSGNARPKRRNCARYFHAAFNSTPHSCLTNIMA
jgi:hypothetical protein